MLYELRRQIAQHAAPDGETFPSELLLEHLHSRVAGSEGLGQRQRLVDASVFDDDDFSLQVLCLNKRPHPIKGVRQAAGFIMGRDDN